RTFLFQRDRLSGSQRMTTAGDQPQRLILRARQLQALARPHAIAVPLEMWSNDITYGRLIDAAEEAGDREELRNVLGEASMYRSMLEDEWLEREGLRLEAIARKHLVAIPHYDGRDDNKFWEQNHRYGRVHLTIEGIAKAQKTVEEEWKRRWGRR